MNLTENATVRRMIGTAVLALLVIAVLLGIAGHRDNADASAGGSSTTPTTMTTKAERAGTDQNKQLIARCTDEYNQRHWDILARDCYAPTFVDHTPEPGQQPDFAGFKKLVDTEDIAFPDWRTTIVDLVAERDEVVMRFDGTGTQTGPLGALPATNKAVKITGTRTFTIHNGRITDTWVNYDELGLLQQLGVVPAFPAAG